VSGKYERIDAEKANYPIVKMCAWLGVSNSGFHEWRMRDASFTERRREMLKDLIIEIFTSSEETYGYRRVWAELDDRHVVCCPETVRALMRELGLVACQPKPWRPVTTIAGDAGDIPDLVARGFTANAPRHQTGRGYHVYSDAARMGVSRHRHRLLFKNRHRLRHR
jgi:hypothetical protein